MNRSSRRKNKSPYTTSVLDKTISNLYNESFATSIGSDSFNIDSGKLVVALQNNRTNVEENIYAPLKANKETPIRGVVQFDLKNSNSGIGSKDTVVQAVLFLKVNDISPVWPGYAIDICKIDGVSVGTDVNWQTTNGSTKWSGDPPQIGIGYSLTQEDDTPFSVNGYYPLYLTKQVAVKKSPTPKEARNILEKQKGWIGYHEHKLNGTIYYMPNGLDTIGKQYHGNYDTAQIRYGFNEYRTENEARRRAIEIGCVGFHTIQRNGTTIYKPCKSNEDLRTLRDKQVNDGSSLTIESVNSVITQSTPVGNPIPTSVNQSVIKTKDVLRINGSKINDADTDETETNVVDDRNISFNLGGGRIEKDTYGQEVKISKLISRSVRPGQIIPFDVTPLVTTALGNNQRFLPLLIKGAHSNNKDTESKPNPQVGPQDQYVSFHSFNSSDDSTVYKAVFNTTRNEVTGTINVDIYTSDSAGATPDGTGAYILRPTEGAPTKRFNDFFGSVSPNDTVTFQSGKVNINANTTVDIKNTTLTVEGYNKDYIQFKDNPIAGFTPGTYTNIPIKINKTTTVNEIEIISSSNGDNTPPFRSFEPFVIEYQGDSSGSNNLKTFTPTSIKRRDGNVIVTVKETVTSEQHVDHSGGLQFVNLADAPRLKIYYRTRRN